MEIAKQEREQAQTACQRQPGADTGAIYRVVQAQGEVELRCYPVFAGITLVYHDAHAQSCEICQDARASVFEIRHCREGRMEGSTADAFYSMGPGDLAIGRIEPGRHSCCYPHRHYHGITIVIDVEQAPQCLSCVLDDVNVQPRLLMKKFCSGPATFVARSQPSVEHIFSELYHVPEQIRKGYFKVKVLELLLFLSCLDARTDELAQRSYSNGQRLLAKQVCQYLTAHMDSKITLEQLAERFHVSGTQIKTSVKGVYGVSLYSFIRIQKMESAARMLRDTDLTILEIAGRHGYDNASKFAGAFKTVMGTTPKEYRNAPTQIESMFV